MVQCILIELAQYMRDHLCHGDYDSTGHERHIFSYSSSPSHLKVHVIHNVGSSVPIQSNVPWSLPSTIHIHEGVPPITRISLKGTTFDSLLFGLVSHMAKF